MRLARALAVDGPVDGQMLACVFNLLETSYLLVRLPAYAVNRTKRLIKATRIFWGDTDDVLRNLHVRGRYRDVILPTTVLRRLDAVLERRLSHLPRPRFAAIRRRTSPASVSREILLRRLPA